MTLFVLFGLCLVIILAHLNQIKCDNELSKNKAEKSLGRKDGQELVRIFKRQLGLGIGTDLGLDSANNPYAGLDLSYQDYQHQVNAYLDYAKQHGWLAGAGAHFGLDNGNTYLVPHLDFNSNGLSSGGVDLLKIFGDNDKHNVTGGLNYSKLNGLGAGAKFNWNDGQTILEPSVNFDQNGINAAGLKFLHTFRKRFGRNRNDEN